MAAPASSLSVGIDLGTSNSCMAFLNAGSPQVIPNAEGMAITPSIVALTAQGEWLVGQDAKHQAQLNPEGTVYSIKRFIGRRYTDPEVQRDMQLVPYELARGENDTIRVHLGGELRSPEEISAMVLRKLREDAEKRLGEKITQAVVTVPAYFNDGQRQATKDAGKIAGFEVLRIINEPTAAALAYGLDTTKEKQKIVVYDLGGGTFDVTVLEILNGLYRVVATSGDTHLGGDDFDQVLMEKVLEKFQKDTGVDLKQNPAALQRLREACEQAKCELSVKEKTAIELPFIAESPSGEPLNLSFLVTRAEFESWTAALVERTLEPCKAALKDSGLTPSEIQEVLLVGGMTRMPKVREVVRRFFNREPNTSVNPDEAVALGAAIQSGIILGNVRKALLLDVTPLSLGVETMGGAFSVIIPRNTTIPTKMSKLYTTVKDGQTSVNIKVLQGESKVANQNRMLGFFTLEGLPADVAGNVKVEVTFSIDPNGIVQVSAKNLETGRAQQIKVSATSGLSKEELEKVVKKVEGHKIARKPVPAPSTPEKKEETPSAKADLPKKPEPSPAVAPSQPGEGDFLTAEMIDSLLGGSED